MRPVTDGVVLYAGRHRASDGVAFETTFKVHRTTCRYAAKAEPSTLPAALDLWGIDWYLRFCADGTVAACLICKPDLTDGDTA